MKIVHVSTYDRFGGAAVAARRLHLALRAQGLDSKMLVSVKDSDDKDTVTTRKYLPRLRNRLVSKLDQLPSRLASQRAPGFFSAGWVPDGILGGLNQQQPDVTNLHWVGAGFMRIETLPKIDTPVVWTLHDMWAFCGGEHYVNDSDRYKNGYQKSNRPREVRGLDVDEWIWKRKLGAWRATRNLALVTPSHWLAACARESALFRDARVEVIPNGIDLRRFQPLPREVVREMFGLPQGKALILFGAVSATSDRRKGFHLLREAIQRVSKMDGSADVELVVFGASSGPGREEFGIPAHYLGRISEEISLCALYSAADVFVVPSIADNLPNTVIEAMACGTPVVAFNIGGMPDMVDHKENGYLAPAFSTDELAHGLHWTLQATHNVSLAQKAREKAVRAFSQDLQATRYKELYRTLVNSP